MSSYLPIVVCLHSFRKKKQTNRTKSIPNLSVPLSGKLGDCLLGESQMSLSSLPGDDGSSYQSSSSCSRLSTCGSVDANSLCSAFEELSFSPLSACVSSSEETRHSFTFLDSAHLTQPDPLSPLCYPLTTGSATDLSTQLPFYRSQSKRRTKQGARKRFTSLFSSSQGSVVEDRVKEDV